MSHNNDRRSLAPAFESLLDVLDGYLAISSGTTVEEIRARAALPKPEWQVREELEKEWCEDYGLPR